MPQLSAYSQFDLNAVNLNWFVAHSTGRLISHLTSDSAALVGYVDSLQITATDGTTSFNLIIGGNGFVFDAGGNLISGLVTYIGTFDPRGALWFLKGIALDAADVYSSLLSGSSQDELNLIQVALSGADNIQLSPFDDIMTGGAGNDTIAGHGGRDILTGGGGADVFIGTASELNGDTITDFAADDRIIVSNATFQTFTFALNDHTLSFTGGALTLSSLPIGRFVANYAPEGGVQLRIVAPTVTNDFDGDFRTDLLWRDNPSGQLGNWRGAYDGSFEYNASAGLTAVSTDWKVAATGDFNGDGRSDILWRNSLTGQFGDWLATQGGAFAFNSAAGLTTVAAAWTIVTTGDFNGDGRDDILWRNTTTGQFGDWLASSSGNGSFSFNAAAGLTTVGLDWHIAAVGDFNGDAREDILWRNDSGQFGTWLANSSGGFAYNVAAGLVAVGNDWTIAGTGDFNGDGRSDILWRNSNTGEFGDWLAQANGSFAYNAAVGLTAVGLDWHIVGIADYNRDGRDDILWRNDNGQLGDWLANADASFTYNAAAGLVSVGTNWELQGSGSIWV